MLAPSEQVFLACKRLYVDAHTHTHTMKRSDDRRQRIEELSSNTCLSELSLQVYADMMNKSRPLRINDLFQVVCPNPAIRSLAHSELHTGDEREDETGAGAATGVDHDSSLADDHDEDEEAMASLSVGDDTVDEMPKRHTKEAKKKRADKVLVGAAAATKKVKKLTDDQLRSLHVTRRLQELIDKGVTVAGSNIKKTLPPRQRDLQLMWEFLGWGQTESGYYVYLYYVGPPDKHEGNIEQLRRADNWQIVPEPHLQLFHKAIGTDYMAYLQQTAFSVKGLDETAHIAYDVRYILYKWHLSSKEMIRTTRLIVRDNLHLFEKKRDSLCIKALKKRKTVATTAGVVEKPPLPLPLPKRKRDDTCREQDDDDDEDKREKKHKKHHAYRSEKTEKKRKSDKREKRHKKHKHRKSERSGDDDEPQTDVPEKREKQQKQQQQQVGPLIKKEVESDAKLRSYAVKGEKFRYITQSEYEQMAKFPLGGATSDMTFGADDLRALFQNVFPHNAPSTYRWEPVQLVKAWLLVSDARRQQRQLLHTLVRKYNLQFENLSMDTLLQSIETSKEACDDVKRTAAAFTFSYLAMRLLTIKDVIPDAVFASLHENSGKNDILM
jgi:hypothetical protein